jgi:hypothetical protein
MLPVAGLNGGYSHVSQGQALPIRAGAWRARRTYSAGLDATEKRTHDWDGVQVDEG